MHSIMANLNLGQDQAYKEKENRQVLIQWPNLIPYSKLQECAVAVLLLTSNPLVAAAAEGFLPKTLKASPSSTTTSNLQGLLEEEVSTRPITAAEIV